MSPGAGELVGELAAALGPADGHEVVGVVGEQAHPLFVAVGVEKGRFVEVELLDLELAHHRGDLVGCGRGAVDRHRVACRAHSTSPGVVLALRMSQSRPFIHCAHEW
jgi:hypothetical protein